MTPALHDEGSAKRFVTTLQRVVVGLIALAVAILLICLFLPEVRNRREQAARVENLREQVQKQRTLLAERTKQIELLKNDPSYLEVVARDKLDLMKPGETILRLDTPNSTTR